MDKLLEQYETNPYKNEQDHVMLSLLSLDETLEKAAVCAMGHVSKTDLDSLISIWARVRTKRLRCETANKEKQLREDLERSLLQHSEEIRLAVGDVIEDLGDDLAGTKVTDASGEEFRLVADKPGFVRVEAL